MTTKVFVGILLVIVGFVMGMLALHSTNRQLERDLTSTRQQVAKCQTSSQLWQVRDGAALLALEIERKNYGTAADSSTRFFDQLRALVAQTQDPSLKDRLQQILNSRDRITSGIAKQDPAVASEVQTLAVKIHEEAKP